MNRTNSIALILITSLIVPSVVLGGSSGSFGIRGGVGSDFTFQGMAFGGGASYAWIPAGSDRAFEIGADLFGYSSTDPNSDEDYDGTTYTEKTSLFIFALRANELFHYDPSESAPFFIAGSGIGVGSLSWKEIQNAPGYSNGTGWTYDEVDGTSGALLLNLGVGYTFGNRMEFRGEVPMFIFMSDTGGASAFVPTLSLGVQYRFE